MQNSMKNIALVAHGKKSDLIAWATEHRAVLANKSLVATGTTGKLLQNALGQPVTCLASGPLGGDQQLGALITEQQIDLLIFFWDPLASQPHDPDVKALIRLAVVWNIPVACNRATADFVIKSALYDGQYQRHVPDYDQYLTRLEPKS